LRAFFLLCAPSAASTDSDATVVSAVSTAEPAGFATTPDSGTATIFITASPHTVSGRLGHTKQELQKVGKKQINMRKMMRMSRRRLGRCPILPNSLVGFCQIPRHGVKFIAVFGQCEKRGVCPITYSWIISFFIAVFIAVCSSFGRSFVIAFFIPEEATLDTNDSAVGCGSLGGGKKLTDGRTFAHGGSPSLGPAL
jgi:hypothetical protein